MWRSGRPELVELAEADRVDERIASDTARLHPGYLRAGTSPDGGLTWSLPTLVGHERALVVRRPIEDRTYGTTSATLVALAPKGVRYDFTATPSDPSSWVELRTK